MGHKWNLHQQIGNLLCINDACHDSSMPYLHLELGRVWEKRKFRSYWKTTTLNCLEKTCCWPWEVQPIHHHVCWLALWPDIHLVCVSCVGNRSPRWSRPTQNCTDQVPAHTHTDTHSFADSQLWPPERTGSPEWLWWICQTQQVCEVHNGMLTGLWYILKLNFAIYFWSWSVLLFCTNSFSWNVPL